MTFYPLKLQELAKKADRNGFVFILNFKNERSCNNAVDSMIIKRDCFIRRIKNELIKVVPIYADAKTLST